VTALQKRVRTEQKALEDKKRRGSLVGDTSSETKGLITSGMEKSGQKCDRGRKISHLNIKKEKHEGGKHE